LLIRLWRYCLSVLDKEGPDEETLAAAEDTADDEDDADADEGLGGTADIDGWDVEGERMWLQEWLVQTDVELHTCVVCSAPVFTCSSITCCIHGFVIADPLLVLCSVSG
jgi:hypothetical protein